MLTARLSVALLLAALPLTAAAQEMKADIYTFQWDDRGQDGEVRLTVTPGFLRVDQPQRKFAAIAEQDTGLITGMEIRDGTYWRFSWPEIRARIGRSASASERLRDTLNIPGMASYDLARPLARQQQDDDGETKFMWKPTGQKRTIAGRECEQWEGNSTDGDDLEVWVTQGDTRELLAAVDAVETVAEPLDMVAMRPVLPRPFLTAVRGLAKAEVVPMEVAWGPRGSRSRVAYTRHESGGVNPDRAFLPPDGYREVKLEAIDMLMATGDEQPDKKRPPVRPLGETPFPTGQEGQAKKPFDY